jgi:hypothetical protein
MDGETSASGLECSEYAPEMILHEMQRFILRQSPFGLLKHPKKSFSFSQGLRISCIIQYPLNQDLSLILCQNRRVRSVGRRVGGSLARLARDFQNISLSDFIHKTKDFLVDVTETFIKIPPRRNLI